MFLTMAGPDDATACCVGVKPTIAAITATNTSGLMNLEMIMERR